MRLPDINKMLTMKCMLHLYVEDGTGLVLDKTLKDVPCFFVEKSGTIRKNGEGGAVYEIERRGIVRLNKDLFETIKEYIGNPDSFLIFEIDGLKARVEHINVNRNPDGSIHHLRLDVV